MDSIATGQKELQYNISMKKVNVVSYKEVGFDYNVCDEIFENGTGKDVEGRFLEIGFWKEVFSFYTEDNPLIIKHIKRMQESISNIDDEVLVEF